MNQAQIGSNPQTKRSVRADSNLESVSLQVDQAKALLGCIQQLHARIGGSRVEGVEKMQSEKNVPVEVPIGFLAQMEFKQRILGNTLDQIHAELGDIEELI